MNRSAALPRGTWLKVGVVAVILFAGAAALGWRAGFTLPPPQAVRPEAPWSLPPPQQNETNRDLAVLASRKPWGDASSVAEEHRQPVRPPARLSWRLAGIIQRGGDTFALIAQGMPAKFAYLRVGDALPDGSKLIEITADEAVAQGGKDDAHAKHVYRLFDHPVSAGEMAVPRPVLPQRRTNMRVFPQGFGQEPSPRPSQGFEPGQRYQRGVEPGPKTPQGVEQGRRNP